MPGPAPSPFARRRNARPDWVKLPAGGFSGEIPDWPLNYFPDGYELLWRELWRTPQAEMWAEFGWTRLVARYAKILLICEGPEATAALLGECRQLEDRLGLSPMAIKKLQWEISTEPVGDDDGSAVVKNFDRYSDL